MKHDFSELKLDRVTRRFAGAGGKAFNALDELTITIRRGEFIALLGPSGCGKSTALNCIAGLLPLSGGSIWLDEMRIDTLPPEKRGFGMVFQNYALFPHMSVERNIGFGLRMRGVASSEIAPRVTRALKLVQLVGQEHKLPGQLSGGQQQRVAIARAIVIEPPLILMDEPLSNLDAKLREEARAWLRTLIVTLGLSAIHVTHDQVEAMAIADRIVLLDAGVIAQEGPPTALYNEPATLFSAEFMGSNNRLDGTLAENSGGRAAIELFGERLSGVSRVKASKGAKATGIIRIERVRSASSPGPNRIKMKLKTSMYLGERWELVFARDTLTVRAYASAPLEPGEHFIEFPSEALWVF